jgi:hypothetical protein
MNIISLQQAKATGSKHYFTGNACKRGHTAKRLTSTRQCTDCVATQRADFAQSEKGRASYREYEHSHERRASLSTYMKTYRQKPEVKRKNKNRSLDYKYGMSIESYEQHIKWQDNKCKICAEPFTKTPVVDHCHTNGAIRGLLCSFCNSGLGFFRDNKQALTNAIDYLKSADKMRSVNIAFKDSISRKSTTLCKKYNRENIV